MTNLDAAKALSHSCLLGKTELIKLLLGTVERRQWKNLLTCRQQLSQCHPHVSPFSWPGRGLQRGLHVTDGEMGAGRPWEGGAQALPLPHRKSRVEKTPPHWCLLVSRARPPHWEPCWLLEGRPRTSSTFPPPVSTPSCFTSARGAHLLHLLSAG